ncbi:MAG: hypothetical protein VX640_06535 [Pseudomonadota bacterium]|nr:hypothetical protein [Pseudomonadota bacterium]
MLIVSSLSQACRAFAAHKPARVLSLLSEEEELPCFDSLPDDRHLKLYVPRESCAKSISDAAHKRAEEIVRFVNDWDGEGDILIHCNRGISRSMAAAFIILCIKEPQTSEAAHAARLRRIAPYADPCPLLVSYADDFMGREGRMLEAIEDLPPPCPAISAPVVTLPLAA